MPKNKEAKTGVVLEQLKDGRWAIRVNGNIILESSLKETCEYQLDRIKKQHETGES